MNLSDLLNMQMGDIMPGMRQDPRRLRRPQGATGEWAPEELPQQFGATGEWDPMPTQQFGATGEWGPVSQNVEDMRPSYSNEPVARPQPMSPPQASLPLAPAAPPPSAFRKESSQNPIDNPSVPVPSGTGMIRNTRTGKEYRLGGGSARQSGQELDYTRPVEVFGQGKGHYLKNDPMAALVNGKRVDFGRDTEKERRLAGEDLKLAKGSQDLQQGEASLDESSLKAMMGAMKVADTFGGTNLSGMVSPAIEGLLSVASASNKNKPKAPSGYRWTGEGNLERIPGGPADEKVVNAFHADTTGLQSATSAIDNLLGVAKQVLESPGLEGNYGIRGAVPNIPGSDAANTKALLQRLKDVAGFSALNDLKAAGKNGSSGLGAVTEFEHKILQNQLANVDKSQSAAQARAEIGNLIRATEASKQRLSNHYRSVYGKMIDDSVPDSPVPAPAETKPVIPGTSRAAGKTSFDSLPDPKEYEGKTIRDSHTGQRLKAVGGRWVPA